MSLLLVQGPAGGGKSQLVAEFLESGLIDLVSDITMLWVALKGVTRDADGRFPVREDSDPALDAARYLQPVLVRFALELGARVAVTTSRRNQVERWQTLAYSIDVDFSVRTVDPGEDVVRARLADPVTGELSDPCARAIRRWYGELSRG